MIGRTVDLHRILLTIVYFLRPESIVNLWKAWFSQQFSWVCCCYLDFLGKQFLPASSCIIVIYIVRQAIYFLLWRSYACIVFGLWKSSFYSNQHSSWKPNFMTQIILPPPVYLQNLPRCLLCLQCGPAFPLNAYWQSLLTIIRHPSLIIQQWTGRKQ